MNLNGTKWSGAEVPLSAELRKRLVRWFTRLPKKKEFFNRSGLSKSTVNRIIREDVKSIQVPTLMKFLEGVTKTPADVADVLPAHLREILFEPKQVERRLTLSPKECESLVSACSQLGITRILPGGNSEYWNHFAEAKEIRVLGLFTRSARESAFLAIVNALMNAATFQIILVDPKCAVALDIAAMGNKGIDKPEIRGEIQRTLKFFERCKRRAKREMGGKDPAGTMEVRYFSSGFFCRLTLCDVQYGLLTPYLPPKQLRHTVAFELAGGKGTLLEDCIAYFDDLWNGLRPSKKGEGRGIRSPDQRP